MTLSKTARLAAIMVIALTTAMPAARAQSTSNDDRGFEIAKNLEIFSAVFRNINLHYVDNIDPGKSMKTAIDAMLAALDPYTNYYAESDMEDVKLQLMGEYGGIGALIHQKGTQIYIAEPYEGFPADAAGLKAGDRLVSVGGKSTEGRTTADVSEALRGQAGTSIEVAFERDGKTYNRTITRRAIKFKPVPYFGFVKSDYGYIKLNEFTQNSAADVKAALLKLKQDNPNMKGLILDLRGNGGGLMNEAVEIVNLFVKRGELVVETKGKVAARNTRSYTTATPVDTDIPLAVLINGYSASASEIVAGSLQDFDRAVVIGSRSYGKGLVQNILPMNYNTQMKVTVGKYYIPSGRCIQAIDYSHRDANGKAVRVPDSLKTAFQTRNGRTVYDGFGIEPDVEVPVEYMSGLAIELTRSFHIFDYATIFAKEHQSIDKPSTFQITDGIYSDFVAYLQGKQYNYSTATDEALKELTEAATEDGYIDSLSTLIESLKKNVSETKKQDLQRHRAEIADLLKSEILTRYYYEKGRIEGLIGSEPDVTTAIEILADQARYKKILAK